MASFCDVDDAARTYEPARRVSWVVLALMFLCVLYAIRIGVANWTSIGV
jgi:hypothetical protein